jgi:hypothetical protein
MLIYRINLVPRISATMFHTNSLCFEIKGSRDNRQPPATLPKFTPQPIPLTNSQFHPKTTPSNNPTPPPKKIRASPQNFAFKW